MLPNRRRAFNSPFVSASVAKDATLAVAVGNAKRERSLSPAALKGGEDEAAAPTAKGVNHANSVKGAVTSSLHARAVAKPTHVFVETAAATSPPGEAQRWEAFLDKKLRALPKEDQGLVTDTLAWLGVVQRCVAYMAKSRNVRVEVALAELHIAAESVLFDCTESTFSEVGVEFLEKKRTK